MIATWKSFASGVVPDMIGDHISDVLQQGSLQHVVRPHDTDVIVTGLSRRRLAIRQEVSNLVQCSRLKSTGVPLTVGCNLVT
jgi:hypothetical protein